MGLRRDDERSQRPEDNPHLSLKVEGFEHGQQLTLFAPKVGFHGRSDALQMTVELIRACAVIHRPLETAQQVSDLRVVLFQVMQRLSQVWVGGSDRGTECSVLTLVVVDQRRAEPVTEQQQVTGCRLRRATICKGLPGHPKRFPQPVMDHASLDSRRPTWSCRPQSREGEGVNNIMLTLLQLRRLHA